MSTPRAAGNVTLVTVARAVGVEPMTVSNAYHRPRKLTPALRERILETARTVGYPGPNPAARSLRRGRAGSIGLLFGEALTYAFQDPVAVEFVRGLAEGTARHNTVLQLIAALDADEQEGASLLANAIVDGLVAWTLPERHPLLRLARERNIPLVTHGSPRLGGVPFVGIDDRAAARAAADHLVALGHRPSPSSPCRSALRGARAGATPQGSADPATASPANAWPATWPPHRSPQRWTCTKSRSTAATRAAAPRSPCFSQPRADRRARHERRAGRRRAGRCPRARATRPPRPVGPRLERFPRRSRRRAALTTLGQSLHDQGRTCAQPLIGATRGELAADDLVHLAPW